MHTEVKALVIATLLGSGVSAHEQTPAYLKMKYSTVKNVVKFELSIFNQRERVKYYRIALFDKNFVGLPFSTRHRIIKVELSIFNQRERVKYYRIALFDKNFVGLPFSTRHRIIKVDYQTRKNFDVYVRKSDLDEAQYICTISKTMKERGSKPFVRSMVCSKIMEETK